MSDYLQHLAESVSPVPSPTVVRPALPSLFEPTHPSERIATPANPPVSAKATVRDQSETDPKITPRIPTRKLSIEDHVTAVKTLSAKAVDGLPTPIPGARALPNRHPVVDQSALGTTRPVDEFGLPTAKHVPSPPGMLPPPTPLVGQQPGELPLTPGASEPVLFPPRVPFQPAPVPAERPLRPAFPSGPSVAPSVQITIGRIEVRAVSSRASPSTKASSSKPSGPPISLDDYLRQRKGGAA